jgi:hypothetical protein
MGVGYRRDPLSPPFHVNLVRGMRFIQLSTLVRERDGFCRMVPIDFQTAPLPQRPARHASAEQVRLYQLQLKAANINSLALARVQTLHHQLDAEQQQPAQARPLRVVVDGRFANAKLLKNRPFLAAPEPSPDRTQTPVWPAGSNAPSPIGRSGSRVPNHPSPAGPPSL